MLEKCRELGIFKVKISNVDINLLECGKPRHK
jgi:hypothetical protein